MAGDAATTARWSRGVLVALADGLGHGAPAAAAAVAFLRCIEANADLPLDALLALAHRTLAKTRGTVASLARFDEEHGGVEVAGIGNVATVIVRPGGGATGVPSMPGILGSVFRSVHPQSFPFGVGDVLAMHTDGVVSRFDMAPLRSLPAQAAAEVIVRAGGKDTDDAACVVACGMSADRLAARKWDPASCTGLASPRSDLPAEVSPSTGRVSLRGVEDRTQASDQTRAFARAMSFTVRREWELGMAASDLAAIAMRENGDLLTFRSATGSRQGVEIEITCATVRETDLATLRRRMDDVQVAERPGGGFRVVATKHR